MRPRKETLIILSPGFAASEQDTTCLTAQQRFVLSLQRLYPNVQIIILAFQYPYRRGTYRWRGVTITSFNGIRFGGIFKIVTWMQVYLCIKSIAKRHSLIGFISFWCLECALVGKLFSKKNNLRHLIWVLGQDAQRNNPFVKLISPLPNELVAISPFVQKEFFANHRIKPDNVVPNGIDPSDFNFPIDNGKTFHIIGVGSLIPLKRYDLFIDVVKELVAKFPNLKTIICGKGPEQPALRKKILDLRLTGHIELKGEIDHQETLRLMSSATICLHPSSYEGFSTACIEALFAGCHVVSSTNPTNEPIKNWHVVENPSQMVNLCVELLSLKPERERVVVATMDESARKMFSLLTSRA